MDLRVNSFHLLVRWSEIAGQSRPDFWAESRDSPQMNVSTVSFASKHNRSSEFWPLPLPRDISYIWSFQMIFAHFQPDISYYWADFRFVPIQFELKSVLLRTILFWLISFCYLIVFGCVLPGSRLDLGSIHRIFRALLEGALSTTGPIGDPWTMTRPLTPRANSGG
jgi:hypothetical protein